ncbi:restriction endonuclease subunit S [Collinsella stercoris]|uniref:restriction endonuclease subunit S n=1 Tax=Collinsella stercoris TaxID=147206 RepID=UPI0021CC3C66|nr:restriction endonuclease subunit S [Collinsella stercoris]
MAWEQRKLGELCAFSKGHGYSKANIRDVGTPLILYGRLYTQYESRIEDVDTFTVEQDGSLLSKGNEVIVPASGETAEDIAVASSVRRSGIILGGDLNVITPVCNLDPDYTALAITYSKAHDDLAKRAQGKSVVHVHGNDIAEVEISYPSESEQRCISSIVLDLDSLITLHQRKCQCRSLCGYLSWEQRKLGDVTTIVGGGTPSTNNSAYWDGDIDWYSPAELGEQVYADRSVRRITQAGYDSCSATLLPAGKAILFTSRAGIGNTAILRRSACTNQGFQSLVVNDDTDVYFVYSMTDRIKKFAEQKASGSTFLEISGKGLAAGEFAFPSKDEQTAIGSMFKQLDHLITLHQ